VSEEHFSAEEQAQFDAMRAAEYEPEPQAQQPAQQPAAPSPEVASQEQPPQPPKMVRLEALHEERERRKQLEKEITSAREQQRLLEERTNLLLQRYNQQQQPQAPADHQAEPAIPDLATDPVGHIVSTQRALSQRLEKFSGATQEQQEQIARHLQMQQAVQGLTQRAQALEQQFTVEHPDYGDAVRHLMSVRHKELETVGFRDPAERASILQQEGLGLAARSLQFGGNPAEAIYELAKLRGYASRAAEPPNSPAQPAVPGAASVPPPAAAAAERLANIAAGQQHARSIGNASGTGPAPLTAQRLLEMPEAEFAKMLEKPEAMALLGS
jgi:hypothetical protein